MATLTITTTAPQTTRIAAAFGKQLGLTDPGTGDPRTATPAEVKTAVIQHIKNIVRNQERKVLVDAVSVPDLNPS